MLIKTLMLIIFFAVSIGIGVYCKRGSTNVHGFVLGSRQVGPWLTAFAYGTSYFSAVIFIGYAGQFGWKYGISSTWIGLGNAFVGSLMAWSVLGRRTRILSQHLDAATMPDYFFKRFDSKSLKTASALIIFIFLIPYTASVYNGLSRLFGMAFNVDYSVCVIGMAVLTAIYVTMGGYMATAINDFIQGIIMLAGIVVTVLAVLNLNGGFTGSLEALAQVSGESGTAEAVPGIFTSFFGPAPLDLLGVIILTSLGTWGLPQMVGKFYAIKSEKDIHVGTVVSTGFAIVVAGGSYFLGGFGRLFEDIVEFSGSTGAPVYDSIMPAMLSLLPEILVAVVVMLVLSASMSTLSSLVLTSSSVLTLDMIDGTAVKNMNEKQKVFTMKIMIVVFIAVSAIIALVQYKSSVTFIAQLMGISWGALAGSFLGPFLYSLYWKKVSRPAVWCSFIGGVGITTLNMVLGFWGKAFIASPINCGVAAMIFSLLIVPAVSMISKSPDKEFVDGIFECYGEKIYVSRKNALEDE